MIFKRIFFLSLIIVALSVSCSIKQKSFPEELKGKTYIHENYLYGYDKPPVIIELEFRLDNTCVWSSSNDDQGADSEFILVRKNGKNYFYAKRVDGSFFDAMLELVEYKENQIVLYDDLNSDSYLIFSADM